MTSVGVGRCVCLWSDGVDTLKHAVTSRVSVAVCVCGPTGWTLGYESETGLIFLYMGFKSPSEDI